MSLLFKNLPLFFAPDIPEGGPQGGISGGTSKEEMVDFLADDEDKEVLELDKTPPKSPEKPDKKTEKETLPQAIEDTDEETDEEIDELSEIEEEIKGPSEEQLELITPVRRRDILKKYPSLFKDFPYLEKAYYREQQFTELLPTIEDAKTAVHKASVLDKFEEDVIQGGNTETILRAVREENPEAFNQIVDNYLPTLAKVDERAYLHVLGNVTKHTIITMVQEAQRSNNEPLRLAAQILNQFVFGSSDFSPPTQLAKGEKGRDNKPDEVKTREQEFLKRQFNTVLGDLNTRVNNTLRNTIEANIDPRQSMTDYVRRNAGRDALDSLNELIGQDTRFKALADKLWEKAISDNFSKESVDRIKSAYLAKAKTLLPTVIKKARNEALRGMGKRVKDDEEQPERKGPVTPGRPRSQQPSGKVSKPSEIPRDMTTLEFLNSE